MAEIDLVGALQSGLSSVRLGTINYARNKATSVLGNVVGQQIADLLGAYLPADLNPEKLRNLKGGNALDKLGKAFFCQVLDNGFVHFEVGVQERDGRPVDNGLTCEGEGGRLSNRKGVRRPDLIFGFGEPLGEHGDPKKMLLIGEVKIRRSTLLQYKTDQRKQAQLKAILRYARTYTYPRTAVFITFTGGNRQKANDARMFIRELAVKEGALAIIVSPGYIGL